MRHLHKVLILLVKNRLIPGGERPWGLPKLVENANDYVPDVHQKEKKTYCICHVFVLLGKKAFPLITKNTDRNFI